VPGPVTSVAPGAIEVLTSALEGELSGRRALVPQAAQTRVRTTKTTSLRRLPLHGRRPSARRVFICPP